MNLADRDPHSAWGSVVLCVFCETNGPSIIFVTEMFLPGKQPSRSPLLTCPGDSIPPSSPEATAGADGGLLPTEEGEASAQFSLPPGSSETHNREPAAGATGAGVRVPLGGRPALFVSPARNCTHCCKVDVDGPLVSFAPVGGREEDGVSQALFVSAASPPPDKFSRLRSLCLRSLSSETFPSREAPILFGDTGIGHALGFAFKLHDIYARGEQRTLSLLLLCDDGSAVTLLSVWERVTSEFVGLVRDLQGTAEARYEADRRSPAAAAATPIRQRGGRRPLRPLAELLGLDGLFRAIHCRLSLVLHAACEASSTSTAALAHEAVEEAAREGGLAFADVYLETLSGHAGGASSSSELDMPTVGTALAGVAPAASSLGGFSLAAINPGVQAGTLAPSSLFHINPLRVGFGGAGSVAGPLGGGGRPDGHPVGGVSVPQDFVFSSLGDLVVVLSRPAAATLLYNLCVGNQVVVRGGNRSLVASAVRLLQRLLPPHRRHIVEFSARHLPAYECALLGVDVAVSVPEGVDPTCVADLISRGAGSLSPSMALSVVCEGPCYRTTLGVAMEREVLDPAAPEAVRRLRLEALLDHWGAMGELFYRFARSRMADNHQNHEKFMKALNLEKEDMAVLRFHQRRGRAR